MSSNNNKIIYLIVFLAGFSFLIYEVSWNRYLSLILGTTVTASTIVLMSFMGGMGVGAYFLGRYGNRTKKSGFLLSKLIAGIGLMSLVNFLIIGNVIPTLYGIFQSHFIADLLFFSLTFILLFIPAFFMGGIIPLVSKIAISEDKNISKKLGTIYAFETLGSTIGGLITGFILLGSIGQKQTIFVAVAINLLVAIYLFSTKKFNSSNEIIVDRNTKKTLNNNSLVSEKIAKFSMFFIGFSILALQIIVMRIFKTYFTNTSYTFTLITTFVILGLSIGSWRYMKRGSFIKNRNFVMLKAIILISVFSLIGLFILIKLPELLLFPFGELVENQFVRLILIPFIASTIIVLPSAIVSGFAFPLACKMYSETTANISKNVGHILMINTIGSVIGPAMATFILIPLLGAGKSILFIIFLLSSLLVYLIKISKINKIAKFRNIFIVSSALIFLIILFAKPIKFLPPSITKFDKDVIAYNETVEGTITVVNEAEKGVFGKSTFVNNSSVIGSNYDAIKVVKMVGHIPFFANIKCEKVLIIGFGIGVTTSAIASHQEVEKIDCIELVPGLVETANNYQEFNFGVYNDNRVNVIRGDGRHYLQITPNKYDLISCDPTHPVLGSGNLYTQEYFQQCYDHLNPEGMVSQYLPLHKLRLNDLLGIIKTFHSVFPNTTVWLGQYHAILFGQKGGNGKIDFNIWKNKIDQMPKDDFFYFEPYHIASCVIFDSESIENFPETLKINTDNLSYTEFFSFDCFKDENLYENLKYFSENRCHIENVFENIDNYPKMDEFVQGNIKLMESLYFSLKGEKENALSLLREACEINSENQEYPFLIKFYFGEEN